MTRAERIAENDRRFDRREPCPECGGPRWRGRWELSAGHRRRSGVFDLPHTCPRPEASAEPKGECPR